MNPITTGVFDTYTEAGNVVRELELLGISGEQVEVVSDAGHDVRGEGFMPSGHEKDPSPEITIVIVRPSDPFGVEQAKDVMQRHGAKVWQMVSSSRNGPSIPPKPTEPPTESSKRAGIGGPGTTGHDPTDLEGRGKDFDVHNPGAPGERETDSRPDPDHLPM